jgi:uncharacterized membrane protein (DUF4010 family)
MDAITLSSSRLAASGGISAGTAWRAIVVAAIANLVFKAGLVAALGGSMLFKRVAILFAIEIVAGGVLLLVWPG